MDDDFGYGVPAEDLRRLKPYLAELEARIKAGEAALEALAHKVMGTTPEAPAAPVEGAPAA